MTRLTAVALTLTLIAVIDARAQERSGARSTANHATSLGTHDLEQRGGTNSDFTSQPIDQVPETDLGIGAVQGTIIPFADDDSVRDSMATRAATTFQEPATSRDAVVNPQVPSVSADRFVQPAAQTVNGSAQRMGRSMNGMQRTFALPNAQALDQKQGLDRTFDLEGSRPAYNDDLEARVGLAAAYNTPQFNTAPNQLLRYDPSREPARRPSGIEDSPTAMKVDSVQSTIDLLRSNTVDHPQFNAELKSRGFDPNQVILVPRETPALLFLFREDDATQLNGTRSFVRTFYSDTEALSQPFLIVSAPSNVLAADPKVSRQIFRDAIGKAIEAVSHPPKDERFMQGSLLLSPGYVSPEIDQRPAISQLKPYKGPEAQKRPAVEQLRLWLADKASHFMERLNAYLHPSPTLTPQGA